MLLQTRGFRAFGDGIVSVVLAGYLAALGMSEAHIGASSPPRCSARRATLAVGLKGTASPRRACC